MQKKPTISVFLKRHVLARIPKEDIQAQQQFILFRIFSFTGSLVALVVFLKMYFTVSHITAFTWAILSTSVILLVNFLFVKNVKNLRLHYFIALITAFVLLHAVQYESGGIRTSGSVYFIAVILYAYTLLGDKVGKYFTIASILHIVYVYFISTYTNSTSFAMMDNNIILINQDFLINFIAIFFLIAAQHNYLQSGKNIIIKNITKSKQDLKHKNEVLYQYNKTLKETNKELEKFANVVSHDLKAPLRAIGSLSDILRDDLREQLNAEHTENFNVIKGRVVRMENLLNGLLDYTKAGRSYEKIESVDIGLLLYELIAKYFFQKNIHIALKGYMPVINTEKEKLREIFIELLKNAVMHSNKDEIEIMVSTNEENDSWKFTVTDNGPGIDKMYHEKIFIIFQTLKARDQFESRGIGLAIVKRIVTDLGGKIYVESNALEGASFSFTVSKDSDNAARRLIKRELSAS